MLFRQVSISSTACLLVVGLLWPSVSAGADPAAAIDGFNKEAATAFEQYAFAKGLSKLQDAVAIAEKNGIERSPELARTYVLLAVGYIAGRDDLYRGLYYLTHALRIDPKVEAPKQLMSPQISHVLKGALKAFKALKRKPPTVQLDLYEEKVQTALDTVRRDARGLVHEPVDEARAGFPIPIQAAAGVDIRAQSFYLYFRAAGKVKFERVKMKLARGAYRANIPKRVTHGRYLHYYIEALDQRGRVAANHGSKKSPNVVTLTRAAAKKK